MSVLAVQKSPHSLTIPTLNNSQELKSGARIDPVPLSTADILMFAGGVSAATSSVLGNMGYSSSLLRSICNVTTLALLIGEFYLRKEQVQVNAAAYLEKNREKILLLPWGKSTVLQWENKAQNGMYDAAILVGTKWLQRTILKWIYAPEIQGCVLLTSAIVAANTLPRALEELKKTLKLSSKEYSWEIARNSAVHGFNASYTLFDLGNVFYNCFYSPQTPIFPPVPPVVSIPKHLESMDETTKSQFKCDLVNKIATKIGVMPQEEQNIQVDHLLNTFKGTRDNRMRQLSKLIHPDRNIKCTNDATRASEIVSTASPYKPPYNHPREIRRIAELKDPTTQNSTAEEKLNFSCKILDGLCQEFAEKTNLLVKEVQSLIYKENKGEEIKDKLNSFINSELIPTVNNRVLNFNKLLINQKDSVVDFLFSSPLENAQTKACDMVNNAIQFLVQNFANIVYSRALTAVQEEKNFAAKRQVALIPPIQNRSATNKLE